MMANDLPAATAADLVAPELHDDSERRITSSWESWQDTEVDLTDDDMWRIAEDEPDEDEDDDDDWDWDEDDEDDDDEDDDWG